ncbi:hypothetical protein C7S18_03165 [Ahniella affigens]|uniref:Integrin n=1 Tax=Ahniella affigens TaxID=2021234 RepID=A0A2P1PN35_9GAMM|nr:hypothetical protein [Ahniella affigens]AVP96251.1 hypothetical protein C7S18_03165 [Ahniella affigens]
MSHPLLPALPWLRRLNVILFGLMLSPLAAATAPLAPAAGRLLQGHFAAAGEQHALQSAFIKSLVDDGKILNPNDDPMLGDGMAEDWFGMSIALDQDTAVVGSYRHASYGVPGAGVAYVFTRSAGRWHRQTSLHGSNGDIDDFFGWSVAISGDTILIGAPGMAGPNGGQTGAAYVFTRAGDAWHEQAILRASNSDTGDYVGWTVALQGDRAIVGAFAGDPGAIQDAGFVHLFARTAGQWQQQASLSAPDAGAGDGFGWSIALSGSAVVIGAPFADVSGRADAGAAYVFVDQAGSFSYQAKLVANDGDNFDEFGIAVAIYQETALIGAFGDDTSLGADSGSAYVFQRHSGTWAQDLKVLASDGEGSDFFGASLAMDADTAVIGAFSNNTTAGSDAGSAYVFAYSGNLWQEQTQLRPSDSQASDNFSWALALSGNDLFASAYNDDTEAGVNAGTVTAFLFDGSQWTEQARLSAGRGVHGSRFGQSMVIRGDTALISASDHFQGQVHVFVRNGSEWAQQATLQGLDSVLYDGFGAALALDGDTALVSAPYQEIDDQSALGAVYVFVRHQGTWTQQAKLRVANAAAYDVFGSALALSGNTALIAGQYATDVWDHQGAVVVFNRTGNSWAEAEHLVDPGAQADGHFGSAVALAGDLAIVGASGQDADSNFSGKTYTFRRIAGNFGVEQHLTGPERSQNARFGENLALSGDTLFVAAPYQQNAVGDTVGSVYVFRENAGGFSFEQALLASDAQANDQFGKSLALSGDLALIGSTPSLGTGTPDREPGLAYVFARGPSGFAEAARLRASDGEAGDAFGLTVALSGTVGMIGAPQQNSRVTDSGFVGAVYLLTQPALLSDGFEGP